MISPLLHKSLSTTSESGQHLFSRFTKFLFISVYPFSSIAPSKVFLFFWRILLNTHLCNICKKIGKKTKTKTTKDNDPQEASQQGFTDDFSTEECWPVILHLVVPSRGAETSKVSSGILVPIPSHAWVFPHYGSILCSAGHLTTIKPQFLHLTGPGTSRADS